MGLTERYGIGRAVLCQNKPLSNSVGEGSEYVEKTLARYGHKFYCALSLGNGKTCSVEPIGGLITLILKPFI